MTLRRLQAAGLRSLSTLALSARQRLIESVVQVRRAWTSGNAYLISRRGRMRARLLRNVLGLWSRLISGFLGAWLRGSSARPFIMCSSRAKWLGERVYRTGPAVGYTTGDSSLSYIRPAFIT